MSPWQAQAYLEGSPLAQTIYNATPDGFTLESTVWAAQEIGHLKGKYVKPVIKKYAALIKREGERAANLWLRSAVIDALQRIKIGHAADDDAIRAEAKRRALDCTRLTKLERMESFTRWHRVEPPKVGKHITAEGAAGRMRDEVWWRRQLRKRDGRAVENLGRDLNLINRRAQCYASDEAVERRRQQRQRNRALMAALVGVNDVGHTATLEDLHDKSISNPTVKRAELMTRLRGFENYAEAHGHVAMFFTISCPSKFHRAFAETGDPNPAWNGSSPRDASIYLSALWALARASLARGSVHVYGFRIAEPHHDGCPHWHLLLFGTPVGLLAARLTLQSWALREDGGEPGAASHRFKAEAIDKEKGGAVAYIAKYVAKNIDGHALEDDLYGNDAKGAATRIDAWASTWGIRQFQQIGGPPVGVWRELRRCPSPSPSETLEAARTAADDGKWAAYVEIQGLARSKGGAWPVALATEPPPDQEKIDRATGEVTAQGKRNRYGEILANVVIGIKAGAYWLCSRLYSWTFDFSRAASAPWTRVNNCTPLLAMEAGP